MDPAFIDEVAAAVGLQHRCQHGHGRACHRLASRLPEPERGEGGAACSGSTAHDSAGHLSWSETNPIWPGGIRSRWHLPCAAPLQALHRCATFGIYSYRAGSEAVSAAAPAPTEAVEALEQLRARGMATASPSISPWPLVVWTPPKTSKKFALFWRCRASDQPRARGGAGAKRKPEPSCHMLSLPATRARHPGRGTAPC